MVKFWLIYAFIACLCTTISILIEKELLKKYTSLEVTKYQFSISTLILFIINIIYYNDFKINLLPCLAGFFAFFQVLLLNKSLKMSNNPGLPIALFRTQIILTTILSYFIFKNPISFEMLLFMIIIIIGYVLITLKKVDHKEKFVFAKWQLFVLGSILLVSGMDIALKKSTSKIKIINISFYFSLVGCILGITLEYLINNKILHLKNIIPHVKHDNNNIQSVNIKTQKKKIF